MLLKALQLRNFRNYKHAKIHFSEGINLIQGKNGAGKTNLLEAISLLSTGRSFRTSHLSDLIYQGESYFAIEAHFVKDQINHSLQIVFDKKTRRIEYNQTQLSGSAKLLGILPSVLYSPHDMGLIAGAPLERRRFLNIHIAQFDPLYVFHLMRYTKGLQHRNALLKTKQISSIKSWEYEMSKSAVYLMEKRAEAIQSLQVHFERSLQKLTEKEDLFYLRYEPSSNCGEKDLLLHLVALYEKYRERELLYGTTLIGPHRDELLITKEHKEAKKYSSEGQKRSCITAMRFAEWEMLKERSEQIPLMSIDDFGAHLDQQRIGNLQMQLASFPQLFLTTVLSNLNIKEAHSLFIQEGKIHI